MPQRRSEEEGEEDEEEGEGDAAGAAAERDAEERRVQRHLLGTMMESAGPFPFERGLREMEEHNAAAGSDHAPTVRSSALPALPSPPCRSPPISNRCTPIQASGARDLVSWARSRDRTHELDPGPLEQKFLIGPLTVDRH